MNNSPHYPHHIAKSFDALRKEHPDVIGPITSHAPGEEEILFQKYPRLRDKVVIVSEGRVAGLLAINGIPVNEIRGEVQRLIVPPQNSLPPTVYIGKI